MPIFLYECTVCKSRIRYMWDDSKPRAFTHCDQTMRKVFGAPQAKFLEKKDPEKGKSVLKDQERVLKERARNFSRENELDDMIQSNTNDVAKRQGWLTSDGKKRKKVDDT